MSEDDKRELMADGYKWRSGKNVHASDCATSNAPAMEPGPCDCSVEPIPVEVTAADLLREVTVYGHRLPISLEASIADFLTQPKADAASGIAGQDGRAVERIIDAARLVVSDYPVAAGQAPDVMTGERGYGSIKSLSDALAALARSEPTPSTASGGGERENDPDDAAHEYVDDYVMTTEGNDYVPTDWERGLIRDALAGFIAEHWPRTTLAQPATREDEAVCGNGTFCPACSVPITELTQQPGCGGPLSVVDATYDELWHAIDAAVRIEAGQLVISVRNFRAALSDSAKAGA